MVYSFVRKKILILFFLKKTCRNWGRNISLQPLLKAGV